ncbi:MAG: hypothetical protein ACI814_003423 [Mariniblastus sp.]|jgi:hypothetical protein
MRERHLIVKCDGSFFALRSTMNASFIIQRPRNERGLAAQVVKTFGIPGGRKPSRSQPGDDFPA